MGVKAILEVVVGVAFIPMCIAFGSFGAALAIKPRGNAYVSRWPVFGSAVARMKDTPLVNGYIRVWGLACALMSLPAAYAIGRHVVRTISRM